MEGGGTYPDSTFFHDGSSHSKLCGTSSHSQASRSTAQNDQIKRSRCSGRHRHRWSSHQPENRVPRRWQWHHESTPLESRSALFGRDEGLAQAASSLLCSSALSEDGLAGESVGWWVSIKQIPFMASVANL